MRKDGEGGDWKEDNPHKVRNAAYCKKHGYTLHEDSTRRLPHLKPHFEKLAMVDNLLNQYDAVLMIDDDASVHRPRVTIESFLDIFSTYSMVLASAGWEFPVVGKDGQPHMLSTWNVRTTQNPRWPHWIRPTAYAPQSGVILWRNSTYTRTLLRLILANNASLCRAYNYGECCFDQDIINAATTTSWQSHVALIPMAAWNCHARDLNTPGRCINPYVVHLAGKIHKTSLDSEFERMARLENA